MTDEYDNVKNTLATCVFHDAAQNGCNHHDAVSRNENRLKTLLHAIPAIRFEVEHTIEGPPFCDVALRIAEVTVHDAEKIVEQFVQTFAALQTTPFLKSKLVTGLFDPLYQRW